MLDLNEVDFHDEKTQETDKKDRPSYYIDGAGYLINYDEEEK